ncbi:hypothetical protein QR680_015205 [Steinernema hermaphroditum]|uniref:Transmembrane protein 17B n=1 Tax=Steinernema hermaphroditum TaxID=289476 RepID=A0AA39IE47_9BILA|nr:hypothetical protein QR680_015205 [Steinernema hermaphroditum]
METKGKRSIPTNLTFHSQADFYVMASEQRASVMRAFPGSFRETLTSLPLQMALHFNVYFAPFWAISHIACYMMKYKHLSLTYQVVLTPVHFLYTVIEVVRLYLGYYGNLSEKISALSGFWISSLILQMPIAIFLLSNEEIVPLPLERFAYIVHLIFLLIQIFAGFFMIKNLADSQVAKFRQKAMDDEKEEEANKTS